MKKLKNLILGFVDMWMEYSPEHHDPLLLILFSMVVAHILGGLF